MGLPPRRWRWGQWRGGSPPGRTPASPRVAPSTRQPPGIHHVCGLPLWRWHRERRRNPPARKGRTSLPCGPGPGLRGLRAVPARMVRVVRVQDLRAPWGAQRVPTELRQPSRSPGRQDELVADDPAPDLLALMPVRGGVAHRSPPDRLVIPDGPRLTQGSSVSLDRQHMQPRAFPVEHVDWRPPGLAMDPAVELGTDLGARFDEIGEAAVLLEQVRAGGDKVAFGDLHRRLRATLGFRVVRDAGVQNAAVVPADRDHLRVPDRDPSDVLDRDGLLVIGQQKRRGAADRPQRGVQARHQRPHRAVPRRHDDPEP